MGRDSREGRRLRIPAEFLLDLKFLRGFKIFESPWGRSQ